MLPRQKSIFPSTTFFTISDVGLTTRSINATINKASRHWVFPEGVSSIFPPSIEFLVCFPGELKQKARLQTLINFNIWIKVAPCPPALFFSRRSVWKYSRNGLIMSMMNNLFNEMSFRLKKCPGVYEGAELWGFVYWKLNVLLDYYESNSAYLWGSPVLWKLVWNIFKYLGSKWATWYAVNSRSKISLVRSHPDFFKGRIL